MMDDDILDAVYPTQNAQYIAVLQAAAKYFHDDALEVMKDSQILESSVLMVDQAFNSILIKLQTNQALAAHLPWLEGMEFQHPILGESRIRMIILDNIVKIKIKCSPAWFKKKPFEQQPDVIYM